jgi:hypothetical protein
LRRRALFLAGALLVAVILAITAVVLGREAQQQRDFAEQRALAAAAIGNVEVDPELSVLLALEAMNQTTRVNSGEPFSPKRGAGSTAPRCSIGAVATFHRDSGGRGLFHRFQS